MQQNHYEILFYHFKLPHIGPAKIMLFVFSLEIFKVMVVRKLQVGENCTRVSPVKTIEYFQHS